VRALAQDHEHSAFSELIDRHGAMVLGVCRRVLRDDALAQDAVQETFLQLLERPPGDDVSVVGWLHRVAVGKATDLVRRERCMHARHRRSQLTGTVVSEPAHDVAGEVDAALLELEDADRTLLVAHVCEGRTQEQLARDTGQSQATVSRRLGVARALLRAALLRRGIPAAALIVGIESAMSGCATLPRDLLSSISSAQALSESAGPRIFRRFRRRSAPSIALAVTGAIVFLIRMPSSPPLLHDRAVQSAKDNDMKPAIIAAGLAAALANPLAAADAGNASSADPDAKPGFRLVSPSEAKQTLDQIPEVVKRGAVKVANGRPITGLHAETVGGKTVYGFTVIESEDADPRTPEFDIARDRPIRMQYMVVDAKGREFTDAEWKRLKGSEGVKHR
jgi:RNA polymerase sigma factor (sigma-70 family)